MAGDSHRVAVVDIGSNSTRLLVAEVAEGRVSEVERQSRVTRLGRGVDLSGQLSVEAIEAACEAIADYVAICREAGVERIEAIATSAVRDASNGSAFVAELRERFALSARVLDGEEEARLTYLGATCEHVPSEPTLVVDIGGGSTELVVGAGEEIAFHTSLQAGVVRHSERHISNDPPSALELEALAGDVRGLIEDAISGQPDIETSAGIAVAGTPTSLASIAIGLEPYDPKQVHGHTLTLASIQRLLSQLASAPLSKRAEIKGMHPDRAPNIVAGVIILVETMRAFGLDSIKVSEHDILYGVAISAVSALDCG
ncbi:MAG: exopolyphosphatase / guanosine-5-triphosphate,3-diphosphate pyrophosphatase [Solirubrobacterales bacterium]|jgi:exopolyphosphatase/guanosine-5'-triphosphate,3'-diphosphate pyrophosphatase|nr:exopolyphosphatase / guanosine-5-triphosphate,3-diphosphate pyrophosphatase [Solirubrobacterales bacterium]